MEQFWRVEFSVYGFCQIKLHWSGWRSQLVDWSFYQEGSYQLIKAVGWQQSWFSKDPLWAVSDAHKNVQKYCVSLKQITIMLKGDVIIPSFAGRWADSSEKKRGSHRGRPTLKNGALFSKKTPKQFPFDFWAFSCTAVPYCRNSILPCWER